jgi:hypothetical protein
VPFIRVENPSKELLDKLLSERPIRPCPDCSVKPGKPHKPGCDVARCTNCGGQAISCDCPNDVGAGDVWNGLWPGTKECYEKGYVAIWRGGGITPEGYLTFDYNRLAAENSPGEHINQEQI